MFTYNNNHIFSGYLKQFLSSFNLPTSKIYSDEFIRYYEEHGVEHPKVVESFSQVPPDVKYDESGQPLSVFPRKVNYLRHGTLQKFEFDPAYNRCIWKPCANGIYYTDKFQRGLTKTLKSEGSVYDYKTHEYLGQYLRYLRDAKNINLMSMYNCFSNKICNNLNITIPFGSRDVEDRESFAGGVRVLSTDGTVTRDTTEVPDGSTGAYKVTSSEREKLLLEFQEPINLLEGLQLDFDPVAADELDTDDPLLNKHTLEISMYLDDSQAILSNTAPNTDGLTISLGSSFIPVKLRISSQHLITDGGGAYIGIPINLVSDVTINNSAIPCTVEVDAIGTSSSSSATVTSTSVTCTIEINDETGQIFLMIPAPKCKTSYSIGAGTQFGSFQLIEDFGDIIISVDSNTYTIGQIILPMSDLIFKRADNSGEMLLEVETCNSGLYDTGTYRIVIPAATVFGNKSLNNTTEIVLTSESANYDSILSAESDSPVLLIDSDDTSNSDEAFSFSPASVTRKITAAGNYLWTILLSTSDPDFILPTQVSFPINFTKMNIGAAVSAISTSIPNKELHSGWQKICLNLGDAEIFTESSQSQFDPTRLAWLRVNAPGGRVTTVIFDDIKIVYNDGVSTSVYTLWTCDTVACKTVALEACIDTRDKTYVVYKIPVRLFEEYTIAIDSYFGAEIFCGLYTDCISQGYKNTDLIRSTYQKYNRLTFKQPVLYDRLGVKYWTSEKDFGTDTSLGAIYDSSAITRYDLLDREQDLYMFIKLPAVCTSSIVVLAGDYRRFNDASYILEDKKLVYKQNRTVLNFETTHSIDSRLSTKATGDEELPPLNNREFTPVSRLQLLALNTKISHPFADRLIEYLVGWAITSEDEIGENISRAQAVMRNNYYKFISDGAWEPKMQMLIYDYLTNDGPIGYDSKTGMLTNAHVGQHNQQGHVRKDTLFDVLGFIDKDAEKLYASWGLVTKTLPTGLRRTEAYPKTTIETIDIYDGLYSQ